MKRELLAVCILCGCGPTQTQTTTTSPTATTTVTITAPPEDAGTVAVVDAAPPSPEPLPPAKPTTIRLATAAGDAIDQELDKGDAAMRVHDAPMPGGGAALVAIRTPAGEERVLEAARDVVAHAYAVVKRKGDPPA